MHFRDAVLKGDIIYVYDNFTFALCEINIFSHKAKVVFENIEFKDTVRQIFAWDNQIIMLSNDISVVIKFDLTDFSFERIDRKGIDGDTGIAFLLEDNLICISTIYLSNSYMINLKNGEHRRIDISKNYNHLTIPSMCSGYIYIPISNKVIRIGLKGDEIENSELNIDPLKPYMVVGDGKTFWIIEKETDCVYKYEQDRDQLTRIFIPRGKYGRIMAFSGTIWLLPRRGSSVLVLSDKQGEIIMSYAPSLDDIKDISFESLVFSNCIELSDRYLLVPNNMNSMYTVDKDTYKISKFFMNETEYDRVVSERFIKSGTVVKETKEVGLKQLLVGIRR